MQILSGPMISRCLGCLLLFQPFFGNSPAAAQQPKKYVCMEPNAASICTPANTCGSASTPCTIDVKRRGSVSATATPSIPNAKSNTLFCVAAGTTVTWESSSKDTGFVIDVGPSSPFDTPGTIIGGSDRRVSVTAKNPGCYRYSVGACTPGAIYGMCGSSDTEMVVTGASTTKERFRPNYSNFSTPRPKLHIYRIGGEPLVG